jgi:hypothetical protein
VATLSNEEIQKLSFGDARLIAIEWRDETDVLLKLSLPMDGRIAHVLCRYATHVEISLSFGDLIGTALTWQATFTRKDQGWHTAFDFAGAPDGAIALDSNEVEISYQEALKAG